LLAIVRSAQAKAGAGQDQPSRVRGDRLANLRSYSSRTDIASAGERFAPRPMASARTRFDARARLSAQRLAVLLRAEGVAQTKRVGSIDQHAAAGAEIDLTGAL